MKNYLTSWVLEGNITIPSALLTFYKRLGLTEEELVLLLQVLSFVEKGNDFPTPEEIASKMTISVEQCTDMLRKLIQKGFISLQKERSENGILYEKYCMKPLWEKLANFYIMEKRQEEVEAQLKEETDIYTTFEKEFGRPLSPYECETLSIWIDEDGHDVALIKAALKEALLSGKLNFRYIDRILFEWKKNGIKTVEQAKNYGKRFRPYQSQNHRSRKPQQVNQQSREIPFYNWLEQS